MDMTSRKIGFVAVTASQLAALAAGRAACLDAMSSDNILRTPRIHARHVRTGVRTTTNGAPGGLTLETVADGQPRPFRPGRENADASVETGLFRWSPHHDGLGDLIFWCGVFPLGVSTLVPRLP
jgi:hypothetical protein